MSAFERPRTMGTLTVASTRRAFQPSGAAPSQLALTDLNGGLPSLNCQPRNKKCSVGGAINEVPDKVTNQEELTTIPCVILRLEYVPEHLLVTIQVPAAQDEAIEAAQVARRHDSAALFPNLLSILPQPAHGVAVLAAFPPWAHGTDLVCLDTTSIDGRLFLVQAPQYCSKPELVKLVGLLRGIEYEVLFGVDQVPIDEDPVHLFPGALITFLHIGSPHPVNYTLGALLQSRYFWDGGWAEAPPLQHFVHFSPGDVITVSFEPDPSHVWDDTGPNTAKQQSCGIDCLRTDGDSTWIAGITIDAHTSEPLQDTSALSVRHGVTCAVSDTIAPPASHLRPIATPCRGSTETVECWTRFEGRNHSSVQAPASHQDLSPEQLGYTVPASWLGPTLLEQSLLQTRFYAFYLASTLLDTLCDHFSMQDVGVVEGNVAITSSATPTEPLTQPAGTVLRLADRVPPCRTFDLTKVQMPIECSFDDVAPLLRLGQWHLDPLPALEYPCHVPEWLRSISAADDSFAYADIHGVEIYTDGSFDGEQAAWAFHVCAHTNGGTFHLGWQGARLAADPACFDYIGEHDTGAFSAEVAALFWTACWCLQLPQYASVDVCSSALTAPQPSPSSTVPAAGTPRILYRANAELPHSFSLLSIVEPGGHATLAPMSATQGMRSLTALPKLPAEAGVRATPLQCDRLRSSLVVIHSTGSGLQLRLRFVLMRGPPYRGSP
ncbi:unnamed protein product [Symbiodinium sp. CCMP2592]|nr:unnamed protein product [Symbiodinium sp. CCMP2592]